MQEACLVRIGKLGNQIGYEYGHGLMTRKIERDALSQDEKRVNEGLAVLADNLARLGFDEVKVENLEGDVYSSISDDEKKFLAKKTRDLFRLHCEAYNQIREKMV
jgi:hypothetical protein